MLGQFAPFVLAALSAAANIAVLCGGGTLAFFDKEQAAAVLKHGLLRRYPRVFASKTGSTSTGNRVVYLDGYAGPGVYADGASGSPMLVARTSGALDKIRNLHCIYVERNPAYCRQLEAHLARQTWRSASASRRIRGPLAPPSPTRSRW